METKKQRIHGILSNIFKGKTVIVGIGHVLRGDDAFGPALVDKLNGKIEDICIDAGSAPENYIGKITREQPDSVLIVDAAHLGLPPGEYDLLRKEELVKCGFTTHDLSPEMFIGRLEEDSGADVYMLAVQPASLAFGEEMSESVIRSLEEVQEMIMEAKNA
jgi:hydrogenase 3 maturation protease